MNQNNITIFVKMATVIQPCLTPQWFHFYNEPVPLMKTITKYKHIFHFKNSMISTNNFRICELSYLAVDRATLNIYKDFHSPQSRNHTRIHFIFMINVGFVGFKSCEQQDYHLERTLCKFLDGNRKSSYDVQHKREQWQSDSQPRKAGTRPSPVMTLL